MVSPRRWLSSELFGVSVICCGVAGPGVRSEMGPAASILQLHIAVLIWGDLYLILLFPFVPCWALSGFIAV